MALPTRRNKQDGEGPATTVPPYFKLTLNLIGFVLLALLIWNDNPPVNGGSDDSNNKNETSLATTMASNETRFLIQPLGLLRKREAVKEKVNDIAAPSVVFALDDAISDIQIIDKPKRKVKKIYDCLYDIDIHTLYKLENIKLPPGKKGFTMNIIRSEHNYNNKEETNLFQRKFLFPIGIGGPELYSKKEMMTVKDVEDKVLNYAFKELEEEGEHHIPLVAIIEEYVDNEEEEKSLVYDLTVCPNMEGMSNNEAKKLIQV